MKSRLITSIVAGLMLSYSTTSTATPPPPIGSDAAILAWMMPGASTAVISSETGTLLAAYLAGEWARLNAIIHGQGTITSVPAAGADGAAAARLTARMASAQQQLVLATARAYGLLGEVSAILAARGTQFLGLFILSIDGGQYNMYPAGADIDASDLGSASFGAIWGGDGLSGGGTSTCWPEGEFTDWYGETGYGSQEAGGGEEETPDPSAPESDPDLEGEGEYDGEYGEGHYQLSDGDEDADGDEDGCVVRPWPDGPRHVVTQLSDAGHEMWVDMVDATDTTDRVCAVGVTEVHVGTETTYTVMALLSSSGGLAVHCGTVPLLINLETEVLQSMDLPATMEPQRLDAIDAAGEFVNFSADVRPQDFQ